MTTRYFDLSKDQKLALTGESFSVAVKIEAIQRGIKPPVTLNSVLNQSGYTGWTYPNKGAAFFEIVVPGRWGNASNTGLAFRTPEEARAALANVFFISHDTHPDRIKVESGIATIQEVRVGNTKGDVLSSKIEEFSQDDTAFFALEEECRTDWSSIRRADYDRKVNLTKRAEYLRLAGNDEAIARAFWAKTEGAEFPTAE